MKKLIFMVFSLAFIVGVHAGMVQDIEKILNQYNLAFQAFNQAMAGVNNAAGSQRAMTVLIRELRVVKSLSDAFEAQYGDYEASPGDELRMAQIGQNFSQKFAQNMMAFSTNYQKAIQYLSGSPDFMKQLDDLTTLMETLGESDFIPSEEYED